MISVFISILLVLLAGFLGAWSSSVSRGLTVMETGTRTRVWLEVFCIALMTAAFGCILIASTLL